MGAEVEERDEGRGERDSSAASSGGTSVTGGEVDCRFPEEARPRVSASPARTGSTGGRASRFGRHDLGRGWAPADRAK
eukprot:4991157-Pyramimonas_sp.AAC.1